MEISDEDAALVLGALDTLGVLLAEYDHVWDVGERAIYEEACTILGQPPIDSSTENDGEEWKG